MHATQRSEPPRIRSRAGGTGNNQCSTRGNEGCAREVSGPFFKIQCSMGCHRYASSSEIIKSSDHCMIASANQRRKTTTRAARRYRSRALTPSADDRCWRASLVIHCRCAGASTGSASRPSCSCASLRAAIRWSRDVSPSQATRRPRQITAPAGPLQPAMHTIVSSSVDPAAGRAAISRFNPSPRPPATDDPTDRRQMIRPCNSPQPAMQRMRSWPGCASRTA